MKYGLIGEKLGHSYSKIIHEKLGNSEYILTEVPKDEIEEFFKKADFSGINVTIPYKKAALGACHKLSDTAREIGSVNTVIKLADGTLFGDNTDAFGFEYMLDSKGIDPKGQKCIVLGSGGSSVMATYVLRKKGAASVTVISRSGEDNYENISKHYGAGIVVNTTPVGMYPGNGQAPLDITCFKNCKGVADLIYNPKKTALILAAEKQNIPCVSGLVMLVAQAKRAHELFFDKKDDTDVLSLAGKISADMSNIVLIGMPGVGKSTVGKIIAKKLSRKFIDTDEEIVKRQGKSIPDIFATEGEAGFRKIESLVLADVCKMSGCVIACGGGVVTVPENIDVIRQNSTVFRIERPLNELSVKGRPLSANNGVEALFKARDPLYKAAADHTVRSVTPTECAEKIIKLHQNSN